MQQKKRRQFHPVIEAFRQRGRNDNEWYWQPLEWWFLALKFAICYFVRFRTYGLNQRDEQTSAVIAITDYTSFPCEFGTCAGWTTWNVGIGFVKNWYAYQDMDGTP